jgi:hypothetical protein
MLAPRRQQRQPREGRDMTGSSPWQLRTFPPETRAWTNAVFTIQMEVQGLKGQRDNLRVERDMAWRLCDDYKAERDELEV